ncbi:MAG TPA: DnaD domain protein [Anaerolineales bacterium]|nr:DnaD domain protein [Anaerolineales bacterium]
MLRPYGNQMNIFKGFTDSETFTQLPDSFFHQLLKEIKDVDELKVTSYFLWRAEHMEGPFRALNKMDFDVKELGLSAQEIKSGLEKAVRRGSLLKVQKDAVVYFLLNSPRGRAGVQAIESGKWNPANGVPALPIQRPNIFKLYEENIGPLTPLIADALKDAEALYSDEWIADVIEIAVKNNKRNWKYCEAILKRWKEEGRHGQKNQRDALKSSERYTQSEFAEYLD